MMQVAHVDTLVEHNVKTLMVKRRAVKSPLTPDAYSSGGIFWAEMWSKSKMTSEEMLYVPEGNDDAWSWFSARRREKVAN